MTLHLYSSLGRAKREFVPIVPGEARIYVCGVTPYDVTHLGHAFSYVNFDVLRRYLTWKGLNVRYVQNVTDIDDDMIMVSKREGGRPIAEIRDENDAIFRADLDRLNVLRPTAYPFATDHIDAIIETTKALIASGAAYEADGDVFFEAQRFPSYGQLNGIAIEELAKRENPESKREEKKRGPLDFLLWQRCEPDEPSWPSPWCDGRPGWSIECTAMSRGHLGDQIDIHGGGSDLIFPHHENEIAQSEAATAKPFVRYWVHGEHLIVDGEKMSKSKGNFHTLRDLLEQGIQPGAVRYALQSVPYKRQLNFTADAVRQAGASLQRLQDFRRRIETESLPRGSSAELQSGCKAVLEKFEEAMDQDLNTAQALAAIFDWVREVNTALAAGRVHDGDGSAILATMDRLNRVLPLWESGESGLDPRIQSLIEQRSQARQARDFALADELRDRIFDLGYLVEDTRDGVRWKKR